MRFTPKSCPTRILIGQPVQGDLDIGIALRNRQEVGVHVYSGKSVLDPGSKTEQVESIHRILSPLAEGEVGTIRCIGLNVGVYLPSPPTTDGWLKSWFVSIGNMLQKSKCPSPLPQQFSCEYCPQFVQHV